MTYTGGDVNKLRESLILKDTIYSPLKGPKVPGRMTNSRPAAGNTQMNLKQCLEAECKEQQGPTKGHRSTHEGAPNSQR